MSSASRSDIASGLAADLIADLEVDIPASANASRRVRTARPTAALSRHAAPVRAVEPEAPPRRGPAVQGVLRLEPFNWYKPILILDRDRVGVRVGPLYAELSLRPT